MPVPIPNREFAPQPIPAPVVAIPQEPQAGGSYTRDPVTGALTLVTPSTDSTGRTADITQE